MSLAKYFRARTTAVSQLLRYEHIVSIQAYAEILYNIPCIFSSSPIDLDCMIKMNIYVNKAVNKRPYQYLSYM